MNDETTNATPAAAGETPGRNRAFFTIIALLLMLVVGFFLWHPTPDVAEFLRLLKRGGPVPFFLCVALLPLAGVPMTPFFLLAGATFGPVTSLVGTATALAAQLSLAYWLARRVLRRFLERLARQTKYGVPDIKPGRHLKFAVLVRVTPGVPPALKHYVIGLAGVPFRIYFWVSWSISFASAAALILLGDAVFDRSITELGVVAVIAAALLLLFKWLRGRLER